MHTASALKQRITQLLHPRVDFEGHTGAAFPAPRIVAEAASLPGSIRPKLERTQAIARTADDGVLDASALRAMTTSQALDHLQQLPGIGPFSAHLILIRAADAPDIFPATEPRLLSHMRTAYQLPGTEDHKLAEIAENWRPFRSWVSFLMRAAPTPPTTETSGMTRPS